MSSGLRMTGVLGRGWEVGGGVVARTDVGGGGGVVARTDVGGGAVA